ncbi:MAG: plastocyanin/azurin family copper-binding protein [Salinibacter sp.]|uniref:plastocyanin/azurin family copper-binding protein n=1 Tax=Salinibacter sp. TaxID=2065818 RepID=UPI0035D43A41
MSNPIAASSAPNDTPDSPSRREFLRRSAAFGLASVGAGTLLAACGGSSGEAESASSSSTASSTEASGGGAGGQVDTTVTLHPKGNQMKYKETEFTVAPGQKVKLVFENTATSPSMRHNVVILNQPPKKKTFRKIGQAGVKAGSSNDYVPQDESLQTLILAHTPISKPGETVSTTFTVPEETGEYGYVCTYPGHWATMRGTMVVTEDAAT